MEKVTTSFAPDSIGWTMNIRESKQTKPGLAEYIHTAITIYLALRDNIFYHELTFEPSEW